VTEFPRLLEYHSLLGSYHSFIYHQKSLNSAWGLGRKFHNYSAVLRFETKGEDDLALVESLASTSNQRGFFDDRDSDIKPDEYRLQ